MEGKTFAYYGIYGKVVLKKAEICCQSMRRDLFVLRILSLIVFCLTHYRLSILVSLENMLNFSGL